MAAKKKITLTDISRSAGVSLSTVSMILNARADVTFSPETVLKVRRTAEELGYKAPTRRSNGFLPSRKAIIIVAPNIANAYYSGLIQAIQQAAEQHEFSTLIYTTYRDSQKEEEILNIALAIGAAGMIFTLTPKSMLRVEKVNRKLPIVIMGDRSSSSNVDTVELDNYSAGMLLGRHMLALGHKHIAFITAMMNSANSIRLHRLQGVLDAYEQEHDCTVHVFTRDHTPQEELHNVDIEQRIGYELTLECLESDKTVSGFIAANDFIAYGVLDALSDKRFHVPDDYSVCGFNNLSSSRISKVDLTTVEHQADSRAHNAFNILIERIKGSHAASEIARVEFSHQLLERGSTAPYREKASAEK